MTAPAASVAAVQKALGCERIAEVDDDSGPYAYCETHDDGGFGGVFTDRGCPVAVAAADAAVEAATPGIQAGALREAADDVPLFEFMLVMDEAAEVAPGQIGAWLRSRAADRIEAHP